MKAKTIWILFVFLFLQKYGYSQNSHVFKVRKPNASEVIAIEGLPCQDYEVGPGQNLISNGDFEKPEGPVESDYKQSLKNSAGTYSLVKNAVNFSPSFLGMGTGLFMAVDGGSDSTKSVWRQTVKVRRNTNYIVSFWVSTINVRSGMPAVLKVYVGDKMLRAPFVCPATTNNWIQFFGYWNSGKSTKATMRIVSSKPELDGNDFGLDRIKIYECDQDVPTLEP